MHEALLIVVHGSLAAIALSRQHWKVQYGLEENK